MKQRIIINADDFGYCPAWNKSILTAFQRGLITSTTLMPNMPGFEDACRMATQEGLHGKIGIHLNLTEHRPLTQPITKCEQLCNREGAFQIRRPRFAFSREERDAVYEELDTQIQRALDAGIRPTHLDSHHHVHTEWPIGPIVIDLARKHGVRAIRLAVTFRPGERYWKRVYRHPYNFRLWSSGLAGTRQCGALKYIKVALGRPGDIEAVVHPRPSEKGGESIMDLEIGEDFEGFYRALGIQDRVVGYEECLH